MLRVDRSERESVVALGAPRMVRQMLGAKGKCACSVVRRKSGEGEVGPQSPSGHCSLGLEPTTELDAPQAARTLVPGMASDVAGGVPRKTRRGVVVGPD